MWPAMLANYTTGGAHKQPGPKSSLYHPNFHYCECVSGVMLSQYCRGEKNRYSPFKFVFYVVLSDFVG